MYLVPANQVYPNSSKSCWHRQAERDHNIVMVMEASQCHYVCYGLFGGRLSSNAPLIVKYPVTTSRVIPMKLT